MDLKPRQDELKKALQQQQALIQQAQTEVNKQLEQSLLLQGALLEINKLISEEDKGE